MNVSIIVSNMSLESRILKEVRTLKRNGYDVRVLAAAFSHGTKKKKKEIKDLDVIYAGISMRSSNKLIRILSYPYYLLMLCLHAFRLNSDIYHCQDFHTLPVGCLLKLFGRKRVIYDAREHYAMLISENPVFPRFIKPAIRSLVNFLETVCCHFVDYIITVDPILEKNFLKLNKNVTVVANFPELMFFQSTEDNALMKKYNNRQLIIYVGGLTPYRGILESIKAIELVRNKIENVKLLFVGPFQDTKYEKKVLDYIKSNNLENLVEFTGPVPYGEVPKYLGISKLGLLLYQPTMRYSKTPYPIKLFEYIGYSLPVISSNLPELEKIINEINCGISVDPTNLREISDAIIYLLENPSEAKKMGENGRKAVEEKYNWEMMEKRLLEVYSDLIKQN
ncbi:MAG: hypothetical protein DRP62_03950 [Planctomycetota bacterium]|nr:MAG: hypothetical protein DRP62_03950 [Planctomycetota bacterium]